MSRSLILAPAVVSVALLGGVTDSPTATTARPAAPSNAKLQKIVRGLVRAGAPGAVVVVRTTSGTRRAASGLADRGRRRPMRPGDHYRIASVTKTFVATVALQLVAEGRLSLADSVERWLPGAVPNGQAITVRQLLGHTSGLFDYTRDPDWVAARIADPGRTWSARELLAVANTHPATFAPGAAWDYSNTNYVVLGLVIEAATGRSLAQELQTRLFGRLALRATSYPTGTAIAPPYAHGYLVSVPPLPAPPGTLLDVSTLVSPSAWGAGQMVSSAGDLTRFFAALVRGRLLPARQLAAMKTAVRGSGGGYGLGVKLALTRCGRAIGHDGSIVGYHNIVWATLDGRRAAAVMVNIEGRVSWNRLREAAYAALCTG